VLASEGMSHDGGEEAAATAMKESNERMFLNIRDVLFRRL
jgi:hypothetical protein